MIQVDRHTIVQVLGSLMQKPEYLSDTDKYFLEPNDFAVPLDRYIFSAIFNLYQNEANKIHAVDVVNYLKDVPLAAELIEKENGIAFLNDCESEAYNENFDYYYRKLKKINLVRDLQLSKDDIDNIYCEDILNPQYNIINERFEQMSIEDIINTLKNKNAVLENKYILNNVAQESRPADKIRERLLEWKEKPEIGCMLQGDIFNTITRGGRKGKLYLRSAGSGVGKAVPNYIHIPTPNGWTTVGEVKVGDYLFDRFGKPTKVLGVYPQEEQKEIYKVYFKSGRVAECCDEHLWSFYSNRNNRNPNKLITSTLREIIDNPKGLKDSKSGYRWSVPICEPVQYLEKGYSIPPYIMGLILGDGSFRYDTSQKGFTFSSKDLELVESIANWGNWEYKKNSIHNYNWTFQFKEEKENRRKNLWVEEILSDYPSLWQTKSETKFIPQDYLFGSVEQRYDLLAGLMDTDGHIDSKDKGRTSFTTISPFLRDNIIELCESLGMTATYLVDKRKDKYTTGECYNIHIMATKEQKVRMFKLKRKKEIAEKYLNNGKREECRDRDSIIKIEATGQYTDMTCFYVDNEEHLFLMNNFVCTHNTRSLVGDACNIAYPIRYDNNLNKWITTGSCEKVLYIMTEQDTEEIDTMILAYLTGYNEDVFTYGTFDPNDIRIQTALDIMEKYKDNMNYARIPDPCSGVVKNLIRRKNFQEGIENFFYDYIFSSPAMLNEYRDLRIREDVALRLFTTTLKNLAVELNAFIMTSTQVSNDDDKNGGFRDFRNVQGSKSIINLVDFACIMSRPTQDELNQISEFKKSFGYAPNLVTDIFKNRRGRWNMVRLWSYFDTGTCRKQDLFLTTANMKSVDQFIMVDFSPYGNEKEFEDLCLLFNTGEVSDGLAPQFSEKYIEPEADNILDNLADAFGDEIDKKKRVHDKGLSDFL